MTGFTDLNLEKDGVGTFNLNRFRIAFRSPYGPQYLARLLIDNFAGYFNGPAATVERLEGDKLKFFGKLPLGKNYIPTPHPDWVRVVYQNPNHGLTVQTLHRDSIAQDDFAVYGSTLAGGTMVGTAIMPGPGTIAGANAAAVLGLTTTTRLNRYHFLAGRRGWRVDYASKFSTPGDNEPFAAARKALSPTIMEQELIFETAAIERSSSTEIEVLMKDRMTPTVIEIWTHMLMKFAHVTQAQILPPAQWPLEPAWAIKDQVHYTWQQYQTVGQLLGSPDGRVVQRIYPFLYQPPES